MLESNSHAFPLFLRSKQPDKSDVDTLSHRFRNIVEEKGHFRTVTQADLLASDEDEGNGQEEGSDVEDGAKEEGEERGTLKHLNTSKQKMFQMVSEAHNQAMYMVDFISLLETKYSDAGERSMSQGLKQTVAPKTLAYDRWPIVQPSEVEETTSLMAAQGQRLKGLTSAAEDLLKAAARLDNDIRKEAAYWEEILSVGHAGWAVCRVAKDQHLLGVQLGFPQAGPLFKNRGFVALDADDEGALKLGQRAATQPKKLRLRISRNGQVSGSNLTGINDLDDISIENRIRAARDSLFEEELLHDLVIEARSLESYGVKWKDSTLCIPLRLIGGMSNMLGELLIDLVSQDHHEPATLTSNTDEHASSLALGLKALMLHTYQMRLAEASGPPAPLSERKKPTRTAELLRPLLTQSRHHSTITQLRQYLDRLQRIFLHAGLDTPKAQVTSTPTLRNLDSTQLLNSLSGPCESEIELPFPSGKDTATINVRTEITPQKPMLQYTVSLSGSMQLMNGDMASVGSTVGDTSNTSTQRKLPKRRRIGQVFECQEELVSHLNELWALDIAHNVIAASHEGITAREQEPEVDIALSSSGTKSTGTVRLRVSCGAAGLSMSSTRAASESYRWTANQSDSPSLKEALQEILKRGSNST